MKQSYFHDSLLIAGLPATGKSSFGNWLESCRGYFHLDFDEEDIVQQRGLRHAQERFWHHADEMLLIEELSARCQPVVLTWGFAPQFLTHVKQLLLWGFVPVWFTADHAAARAAFLQRGGIDVKYFDQHMVMLSPLESTIVITFQKHSIQTLRDDGSRLPFENIYRQISEWLG